MMNIKKYSLAFLSASIGLFLASCNKESYNHSVQILYPHGYSINIYADQTQDSVSFVTYDSYHYYGWKDNPDDFVSVSEALASRKIQNNYLVGNIFTLPVYFTPNTTGKDRVGYVIVDSKSEMDDWAGSVYACYCQLNCHRIKRPDAFKGDFDKELGVYKNLEYMMRDSAMQVTDTLEFFSYDHHWNLSSANPDVIKPLVESGSEGWQKVPCQVSNNLSKNDTIRTTLLLQSSNGAKTTIQFQQAPLK